MASNEQQTTEREKELVRRLARFVFTSGRQAVLRGNSPDYGAARALLAAGLIDRDALQRLSAAE